MPMYAADYQENDYVDLNEYMSDESGDHYEEDDHDEEADHEEDDHNEEYDHDEENPATRDTLHSNFTEIQKMRMKENWTGPSSLSGQEYGVMLIEEKVCEIDLVNAPVNQRRWFQQEITSS